VVLVSDALVVLVLLLMVNVPPQSHVKATKFVVVMALADHLVLVSFVTQLARVLLVWWNAQIMKRVILVHQAMRTAHRHLPVRQNALYDVLIALAAS